MKRPQVHVVGAGLAGSECAYQLAERGFEVVLYEMRPVKSTAAHKTGLFSELVCSNSLGSRQEPSASAQLKWEMSQLKSLILASAESSSVPAGQSLSVDRDVFSKKITNAIENHPNIRIVKEVVTSLDKLPRPAVIATGPLTDDTLATEILDHFGGHFLYFYDAIAPVILKDSINMEKCYMASRYDKGGADYINCPLTKEEYFQLVGAIKAAEKAEPKKFENTQYFESCLPVEVIASRGDMTLAFGPLKPRGLVDPRTGREPFAVVQLRQENLYGTSYNMVGFQTKMKYPDQKRVFRMIPGLENAEFAKLGSLHRNMFLNAPKLLTQYQSSKKDPMLFFAGQITGVEGYFESTCTGMLAALNINRFFQDRPFLPPPPESALGSLLNHLWEKKDNYQPTNINWGLFPPIEKSEDKKMALILRAKTQFQNWIEIL